MELANIGSPVASYSLPVPGLAEKRPSVIIGEYSCDTMYIISLSWES